jgi:hypothetical protein
MNQPQKGGVMSKVRMFEVGEICVHKGFICRVDAVERNITGQNGRTSLAYMNIEDGTELNPTLTMTPLYGPNGEPVKKAKPRKDASGAVEYALDAVKGMEIEIARLNKLVNLVGTTGKAP